MLTFETSAVQGAKGIIEKLTVGSLMMTELQMKRLMVWKLTVTSVSKSQAPDRNPRCTTLEHRRRNTSDGDRGFVGKQPFHALEQTHEIKFRC